MDSGLITIFLPIALAIVMIGLGLELTLKDFARITKQPKVILVALFCQSIVLVGIAFLICKIFALPQMLAVGLMLLAASPGGATANLFSYLYKGDIALNISLTAMNAILSAFTLPLIVNFAIIHFMNQGDGVGLQIAKVIQVFMIIIVPVVIGMLIRRYAAHAAEKLQRPTKIFAIVFLVAIICGAIFQERHNIVDYLAQVGLATAVFCMASLCIGYFVPRVLGINSFQARACAFEIGIHNSTLSMTIALTIMASTTIAMPSAVYSIFMYFFAAIFGALLNKYHPLETTTTT